ncbi:hypothetical protein MM300_20350 [Evansella sp. LMS18]|uniref:hypothetical protein n=1 Tax=Evansella sp. LMS18 TaxID=2924033 RepID=UPI0020D12543|nr:hypothetical protein [Evansella sp. LMS18]UTR10201.1 hypothetical protein MM300_20350 [Evansella sp. LMS18]
MNGKLSDIKHRITENILIEFDNLITETSLLYEAKLKEADKHNATIKEVLNLENEKSILLTDTLNLCELVMAEEDFYPEFNEKFLSVIGKAYSLNHGDTVLTVLKVLSKIQRLTSRLEDGIIVKAAELLYLIMTISYENKREEIYLLSLNLINSFKRKDIEEKLNDCLLNNFKAVEGNIYECLWFPLLGEWMKTNLIYGNREEVNILYYDMLTDFKSFSPSQMNETIFNKLLWYGFLNELDQEFIAYKNDQYKGNTSEEKIIYKELDNTLKDSKIIDKTHINYYVRRFEKLPGFTAEEKMILVNKIEARLLMKMQQLKSNSLSAVESKDEIRQLERVVKLSPKNLPKDADLKDVSKETVYLTIFKDKNFTISAGKIKVDALSLNGKGDVYITKRTQKELARKIKEGYFQVIPTKMPLKVHAVASNSQNVSSAGKIKSGKTNAKINIETAKVINNKGKQLEDYSLRDKSALRNLGYQITNMRRIQRWEVLETAVPRLGLKKVVYIIAHNLKLRKGQKNGSIKFRHSITEWQYDLDRLKQKYYKKDFRWPDT